MPGTGATEFSDNSKAEKIISSTVNTYATRTAGSKKMNKCRVCGMLWERTSSANHRPGCPNTDTER